MGLDWDDLRYILAVAEAGSLAGAARRLGVNHTTVLRRVGAFEKQLGLRVFDRLPTGYVLTSGGEELVAAARRIEETIVGLERGIVGQDRRLSGTVRVTTTDTLMGSILPEMLAQFRASHPGIRVELSIANQMFNLTRRDADVAIRPANDPPEALVGRRVAKIAFAIYGSAAYLAAHEVGGVAAHRWIGLDDSLAATSVARWMRDAVRDSEVTLRTDSLLASRQAAQAGIGLAALPCYLGETSDLVCVNGPVAAMETVLWVLTHEDLRNSARIRAFINVMTDALARRRTLLEGETVRPQPLARGAP